MKNRWFRLAAIAAIVLVTVLVLRTCVGRENLANIEPGEKIDAELTLQTVTLEQPDEDGTLLWRLQAESVTYSPDSQRAELAGLEGDFFQDGKTVYTVTADEGEVQQNGKTLFLRGNLVANSTSNELTLEGERLKWQPNKDLLVMGAFEGADFQDDIAVAEDSADEADSGGSSEEVTDADSAEQPRDGRSEDIAEDVLEGDGVGSESDLAVSELPAGIALTKPLVLRTLEELLAEGNTVEKLSTEAVEQSPVTGFNPQMEAIAQVISVSNKGNEVQLLGGVAAKSKSTPWVTFESDRLDWFTEREVIEANGPIKVEQYDGEKYQVVTDRVVGATAEIQLADNLVTLDEAMQLDSFTQPLKVVSETAVWDVAAQTVVLDKPVNIEQPARKITAFADSADLDLAEQLVVLNGNVRANGEENDARLAADRVQWQTDSQEVEAEGNVSYQQSADPEISMAGGQAFGNLEAGTLVVVGGDSGEVVTEFVPGEPL